MNTAAQTAPAPASAEQVVSAEQTEALLETAISNSERQFSLLQRKAELAAMSRLYPDAVTMESAAIKMMMAKTLGIDEMVALTDIRVVEGKPEISAGLTAALLQREGYAWRFVRYDDQEVSALWFHSGLPLLDADDKQVKFGFTMQQAERAGYTKRGVSEKNPANNYHKVPENMLFARMITNFCKHFAPTVTRGMTIYAPGEIEAAIADRQPEGFRTPQKVSE
jgi:hypothetical protein